MFKYFQRCRRDDRAQSLLEFTVLIIIIMAVFLSMSSYVKRGIQGRWKSAIDDFSDQYDPKQMTNGTTFYSADTESSTNITTADNTTSRVDNSHSFERRSSYMQVGQEGDDFKKIP